MSVENIFNLQMKEVGGLIEISQSSLAGGSLIITPSLAESKCINHFHFLIFCLICRLPDMCHLTFTFSSEE